MSEHTLFEKYGGFAKISKVVISFYDRLLDSDSVGPFFDEIDMAKMVDHQTKFIASLLGGPAAYTDDQLRQVHARLDINNAHFDELKSVLSATLAEHGFAPDDTDAVLEEFERRRGLIVG